MKKIEIMKTRFEEIKNYAPGFEDIFPYIEAILKSSKATDQLFLDAVERLETWIVSDTRDPIMRTFFELPAFTHFSSNIFRRSFLRSVLLVAIDQAIDPEKGNNCFTISIKNTILEKHGFQLTTSNEINDFGEKIRAVFPRICISAHGPGTRKDETYFSVYYKYG